jgi:hypothetical protein
MIPTKFQFNLLNGFRGEDFFRNQSIRNKNCLWWPCLLTDRDEMSILYRVHDIDSSYQVSVHLAKRFQRRRLKCEKITDKSSHCLWQGELKKDTWKLTYPDFQQIGLCSFSLMLRA